MAYFFIGLFSVFAVFGPFAAGQRSRAGDNLGFWLLITLSLIACLGLLSYGDIWGRP